MITLNLKETFVLVLGTRLTPVYMILPFIPAEGQWNDKHGQNSFEMYQIDP